MSSINPNNPPPPGLSTPQLEWIEANILAIKKRINAIGTGGGGGSVGNLQQVTTNGNTTTDNIEIVDGSGNSAAAIGINPSNGFPTIGVFALDGSSGIGMTIAPNGSTAAFVSSRNLLTTPYYGIVTDAATSTVTRVLPSRNGVIALEAGAGRATLSSGTVSISDSAITANSIILATPKGTPTIHGIATTNNAGVGFSIDSSDITDSRDVDYYIVKY